MSWSWCDPSWNAYSLEEERVRESKLGPSLPLGGAHAFLGYMLDPTTRSEG